MDQSAFRTILQFSQDLDSLLLRDVPILSQETLRSFLRLFSYPDAFFAIFEGGQPCATVSLHAAPPHSETISLLEQYLAAEPLFLSDPQAAPVRSGSIVAEKAAPVKRTDSSRGRASLFFAFVPVAGNCLAVSKAHADFTDGELAQLAQAGQVLAQKLRLDAARFHVAAQSDLRSAVLDHFSVGLLAFNERCELLHYNPAFLRSLQYPTPRVFTPPYLRALVERHRPELAADVYLPIYDARIFVPDCSVALTIHTAMQDAPLHRQAALRSEITYLIVTNTAEGHQENNRHAAALTDFAAQYGLSPREMEIVRAIAGGDKYETVAEKLFVSPNTVRTHIKNIYAKLGINNQRALLSLYNQYH